MFLIWLFFFCVYRLYQLVKTFTRTLSPILYSRMIKVCDLMMPLGLLVITSLISPYSNSYIVLVRTAIMDSGTMLFWLDAISLY